MLVFRTFRKSQLPGGKNQKNQCPQSHDKRGYGWHDDYDDAPICVPGEPTNEQCYDKKDADLSVV
jgi:hypothetical protein